MKVFLPFKRDENRYLDEIENHFQGEFIYGELKDFKKEYDIVNIHWPEAIFKWKEPTDDEISELRKHLVKWKKYTKVIYTRHNELPHYRNTNSFKALYRLVQDTVDGVIHLGNYSKEKYSNKYQVIKHAVIEHPLYTTIPNTITKEQARKKLNIKYDKKVVLVFGAIRSIEEQSMILKSFKDLKLKDKQLLIARYPYFVSSKIPSRLKRYYNSISYRYYKYHRQYNFFSGFVPTQNIQDYIQAADVVYIARKRSLNSGNIFLGFTFKKVVVGPDIGNMSEPIKKAGFPLYNPSDNKSISNALQKGFEIASTSKPIDNFTEYTELYHPQIIAKKYFDFFGQIINE